MNSIQVSIIFSFWNSQLVEMERSHEFSIDIETSLSIDQFEQELKRTIMMDKGDGLYLDVYSVGQYHVVDVILLLGEPDQDRYDIDYLKTFLQKFKGTKVNEVDMDYSKFDSYLYLAYAPQEFANVVELLKNEGIEAEVISERRSTYERGAGDYFLTYLLGLASTVSPTVIKKISNHFNDEVREIQSGKFPGEIVKRNLSNKSGENPSSLKLVSFVELPNKEYKAIFKTRYDKFTVVTDVKGNISSFEMENLTQTRI